MTHGRRSSWCGHAYYYDPFTVVISIVYTCSTCPFRYTALILQISVFRSKQKDDGPVLRGIGSELIEITARRSDNYKDLLDHAVKALQLKGGKSFCLFRWGGTRIINEDVYIGGTPQNWTLKNYLLTCRKSASQIKFGVGVFKPRPVMLQMF